VPAFRVKLGANDLNCVDVPLNPTHSLALPAYHNCSSPESCVYLAALLDAHSECCVIMLRMVPMCLLVSNVLCAVPLVSCW